MSLFYETVGSSAALHRLIVPHLLYRQGGWLMYDLRGAGQVAPACSVDSGLPLQPCAAPRRPWIYARIQHAPFSGGPMAGPCSKQQRVDQHRGRLPAHRSSSPTVQTGPWVHDSCPDRSRTQLRTGSWTDTILRPQHWHLPDCASTAVLLSACGLAACLAAGPALADTFRSPATSGPFVPGLSTILRSAMVSLQTVLASNNVDSGHRR